MSTHDERGAVVVPGTVVTVGRGLLASAGARTARAAPAHRWALISDATVAALHGDTALASFPPDAARLFTVPAGEAHKTRESWATLTDALLDAGFGRDTTVVALGGGVIGDLAGFVAATFLRGVPVVQLPTTLLAMIDASVGGKTGVDTAAGKNLVGAFHPPAAVLADLDTLATLPPRLLRAGLAEAIKHGVVADERYLDAVLGALPRLLALPETSSLPDDDVARPDDETGSDALHDLVVGSVAIKSAIVARDPREQGPRKALNFGHTLGHAIETLGGWTLLHGEAVAIGMALESGLAEAMGVAECGTTARVCAALAAAGLPVTRPATMDADAILAATQGDKKARRGVVEYALPRRIGAMAADDGAWAVPVPDALVREILA